MSGINTLNQGPPDDPYFDQWEADMQIYRNDVNQLGLDKKALKDALAALSAMKDPMEKLMYVLYMIFPGMMQTRQDNIKILSDNMNVNTDLRQMMNQAQQIFNDSAHWSNPPTPEEKQKALELAEYIDHLENAVNNSVYKDDQGNQHSLIPPDELKNIKDAIGNIKSLFGDSWGKGDGTDMAKVLQGLWGGNSTDAFKQFVTNWMNDVNAEAAIPGSPLYADLVSKMNQSAKAVLSTNPPPTQAQLKQFADYVSLVQTMSGLGSFSKGPDGKDYNAILGGDSKNISDWFGKDWGDDKKMLDDLNNSSSTTPPDSQKLKQLNNDFQTINQTVSTLGTSVNTQLSFYTNDYNQVLGIFDNALKDVNAEDSTFVQNSRASL